MTTDLATRPPTQPPVIDGEIVIRNPWTKAVVGWGFAAAATTVAAVLAGRHNPDTLTYSVWAVLVALAAFVAVAYARHRYHHRPPARAFRR